MLWWHWAWGVRPWGPPGSQHGAQGGWSLPLARPWGRRCYWNPPSSGGYAWHYAAVGSPGVHPVRHWGATPPLRGPLGHLAVRGGGPMPQRWPPGRRGFGGPPGQSPLLPPPPRCCSRASSRRRSISSSAAVAFPAYLRRVIQSSCRTASMVSGNRHHPGTYGGRVAGATPRLEPTTGGMLAGGEGSTEAPTTGVGCGDGWSTWVTTWGSGESCRPGGSAYTATGPMGAGAGSYYEAGSLGGDMGASGCSAAAW